MRGNIITEIDNNKFQCIAFFTGMTTILAQEGTSVNVFTKSCLQNVIFIEIILTTNHVLSTTASIVVDI